MTRLRLFQSKKLCVAAALLLLAGSATGQAGRRPKGATDAPARKLLRRMLQAERGMTVAGTQITTVQRGTKEATSEQRVLRDGDRRLRQEYKNPPRLAGETVVDDGAHFWRHNPRANTLASGPSRLPRQRRRWAQILGQLGRGGLNVRQGGHALIAGRDCIAVEVGPRPGPRRVFWIDPKTGAQLASEQFDAAGARQSASRFTEVTLNAPLDPRAFDAPRTRPDVQRVAGDLPQAQAGFSPIPPAYLPPGFAFQSSNVERFQGRAMIALRYASGPNVLSLFETPAAVAQSGPGPLRVLHPRDGSTVVIGRRGGLRVVLVGSLSVEEMRKVANSIR